MPLSITEFLNDELQARTTILNKNKINPDAKYVLIWLQQTLRGYDNPIIDAGVQIANKLGLPALVYHGLRDDYPYASDRLHYFIIGASKEMAVQLRVRGIAVAQHIVRPGNEIKGLVYKLAAEAAVVVTDKHATFIAKWQSSSFASKSDRPVIAVDGTRLVPHSLLPSGLTATKAFRAAHTPLREQSLLAREQIEPEFPAYNVKLAFEPDLLAEMSEAQILELIAKCRIDHSLPPCSEYLPTRISLIQRLEELTDNVIQQYKWKRNNPATKQSSSNLSPYLHFGMTSPFEIMRKIENADISKSVRYKFYDELLTWREWCHWRMTEKPGLNLYGSLPTSSRKTMEAHENDPREPLLCIDDLIHGNTPDETWNAAQRQWLATGWMHNNLRMYWAKQILKWTPTPQLAWATACYLNDRLSLDGRDPATYIMMRWAFGEARPGYSEQPIYGWVSQKSDSTLRKREGAAEWLNKMAAKDIPQIDCPANYEGLNTALYI